MEFDNILYPEKDKKSYVADMQISQECYENLMLDRIIESIIDGREGYDLEKVYRTPLKSKEAIAYRQDIFLDIANEDVYQVLVRFGKNVRQIQDIKMKREFRYYKWQQLRWDLHCVTLYCEAVKDLTQYLKLASLNSQGMCLLLQFLEGYCQSDGFTDLDNDSKRICDALGEIQYLMRVSGDTVYVKKYNNEINLSDEVISVFHKFKQHNVENDLEDKVEGLGMNHVEGQILDRVALLFPDEFSSMEIFLAKNEHYFHSKIEGFERDMQFYLSFLAYMDDFKAIKLPFCLPQLQRGDKRIFAIDAYDLALAYSIKDERKNVIKNDFELFNDERILLISGPNQGGKTTFARMIGQMHYLALLGTYVPAERARLYLPDCIYTHFEQSENIKNLRGKLYDDLVRIKTILDAASSDSLIIMNEIFTSTTAKDATYLATKIMERIVALGAISVCVTFIDELTTISKSIVSMMSTVDEENVNQRTYKVIRKPFDGVAYSSTLVKKYALTYAEMKKRIGI